MKLYALAGVFGAATVFLAGCGESKPTVFENKHDHDHVHERGKMKIEDVVLPSGECHVGLTAHLSKKDGNELDVIFETEDKEPKPVALPLAKLSAKATRTGDEKSYTVEFEPAEMKDRKTDPEGKCSRFTAKAPWIKHEDVLTVILTIELDGQVKKVVWTDFNPKKYAHVDE